MAKLDGAVRADLGETRLFRFFEPGSRVMLTCGRMRGLLHAEFRVDEGSFVTRYAPVGDVAGRCMPLPVDARALCDDIGARR